MEEICHVRLVATSSPVYGNWMRHQKARHSARAVRDPLAQDYCAELRKWERLAQRMLGEILPEVRERILMYRRLSPFRRYENCFHEIDFVAGIVEEPTLFVELKLRESIGGKTLGWQQLRRSLAVARTRWKGIKGICLNVAMAGLFGNAAEGNRILVQLSDLRTVCTHGGAEQGCWISGAELSELAMSKGWLTAADVDRLREFRSAARDPLQYVRTDRLFT